MSSEVRPHAKLDSELVKRVTGGDSLKAAAKYEDDVEIRPTFTLWWAANDRPRVRADDAGLWSRVRVLGCQHAVPRSEQNPRLAELWREPEHARAILAWLVEGCAMWQRDGLGSCTAVDAEVSAYRDSQDPTAEFWDDCVKACADASISRAELWAAWERWNAVNGGDGCKWITQKDLYAKLTERYDVNPTARQGIRGFKGVQVVSQGIPGVT